VIPKKSYARLLLRDQKWKINVNQGIIKYEMEYLQNFVVVGFVVVVLKLCLITYNMQGLNDPVTLQKFNNYYLPLQSKLDIWYLQEHKLRGQSLDKLGNTLWRATKSFNCEATLGNQGYAGKGSLSIFVSSKIQHLIKDYGVLRSNQAQWLILLSLPRSDISIVNIYALHAPQEHIILWQALVRALPAQGKYVFCGDWNMVEYPDDKSSLDGRIFSGTEKLEFDFSKLTFKF
jgi:exonuclease III